MVDDPAVFLTAALVVAAPWPYCLLVHVAAWSGLRSAELAGLQVGDVELPVVQLNPNARAKPGTLRVERTLNPAGGYDTPKTRGSRRRVQLPTAIVAVLRGYLAEHPRADETTAPLFPAFRLAPSRPTEPYSATPHFAGVRPLKAVAQYQAEALAEQTVEQAEQRLQPDWSQPAAAPELLQGGVVLRTNRAGAARALPPGLKFHALRHTYASLCVAAGIPPLEIARFMGHAKVITTLSVYAHLFEDDHTDAMSALGAMGHPCGGTVVSLTG